MKTNEDKTFCEVFLKSWLFTAIVMALFISFLNGALACQLSIPESYVPTFLNPPVSGHYQKCESEPCHCVDSINPWYSELVDNEVIDYVAWRQVESCTDEADCDDKFSRIVCTEGEEIKNYEQLSVYCAVNIMKIDGKKLVESPSKKAAYEAAKLAEKEAEEDKVLNKKAAIERVKAFEPKGTTISALKAELKAFASDIKEVIGE